MRQPPVATSGSNHPDLNDGSGEFNYEYNLTDHLGNVRVVVKLDERDNTPSKIQEKHYYPFGMELANLGMDNNDNKFLYNGKELCRSHAYGRR